MSLNKPEWVQTSLDDQNLALMHSNKHRSPNESKWANVIPNEL